MQSFNYIIYIYILGAKLTPKLMVGILKIQSCHSSKTENCDPALVKHLCKSCESKIFKNRSMHLCCGIAVGCGVWLSLLACALTVGCQSIWCWPLTSPVPQELREEFWTKFLGRKIGGSSPFVCFKHCGCQGDLINYLIC